jgi:hypothetical protein
VTRSRSSRSYGPALGIERSEIDTGGGGIAGRDQIEGDQVSGDKLVIKTAFFSSDLAQGAGRSDPSLIPMPRLLPYLTDRTGQQGRLAAALQKQFDDQFNRPLTFFVAGSDDECLDSFVEQIRYVCLPRILSSNNLPPAVLFHSMQWVASELAGDTLAEGGGHPLDEVRYQMHCALGLKASAHKSVIEQRLAVNSVSCLFHIGLSVTGWNDAQVKLMAAWLAWIGGLDLSRNRNPFVTVVSIVYPSGFLQGLLWRRSLAALRRDVRSFADTVPGVQAMPDLHSVRFDDIEHWIREYVEDADREALRRLVRRHFSGLFGFGQRALSMYEAAKAVKAALQDPSVRTGLA